MNMSEWEMSEVECVSEYWVCEKEEHLLYPLFFSKFMNMSEWEMSESWVRGCVCEKEELPTLPSILL